MSPTRSSFVSNVISCPELSWTFLGSAWVVCGNLGESQEKNTKKWWWNSSLLLQEFPIQKKNYHLLGSLLKFGAKFCFCRNLSIFWGHDLLVDINLFKTGGKFNHQLFCQHGSPRKWCAFLKQNDPPGSGGDIGCYPTQLHRKPKTNHLRSQILRIWLVRKKISSRLFNRNRDLSGTSIKKHPFQLHHLPPWWLCFYFSTAGKSSVAIENKLLNAPQLVKSEQIHDSNFKQTMQWCTHAFHFANRRITGENLQVEDCFMLYNYWGFNCWVVGLYICYRWCHT